MPDILDDFVACFAHHDDLIGLDIPEPLVISKEEGGWVRWRPILQAASPTALERFYAALGLQGQGATRLPILYEKLILSYRWSDVEIGSCRLLANPPGDDLIGLAEQMMHDRGLWDTLFPNGYIQFARAPGGNYDPVCFDLRHRQRNGDCRIVQIDHEQILCNYRIKVVAELAPNFRTLVQGAIRVMQSP